MAQLTHARLRELVHYDPETGVFRRKVQTSSRAKAGDIAGSQRSDGYILFYVDGVRHYAQRLAWLYMTGNWPEGEVDHEDGNPGRNVWTNLRDGSHRFNMENRRRADRDSKTGILGVSFASGSTTRYSATIRFRGGRTWLGRFDAAEEAHAAYLAAKRILHAGNTL